MRWGKTSLRRSGVEFGGMILKHILCAMAALALSATPAAAKQWKAVEPLASGLADNLHVVGVEISATGKAAAMVAHFDAKAEEKRKAASGGTTAVDATTTVGTQTAMTGAAPVTAPSKYETLPFSEMVPLVIGDVTKEWGLTQGRAVKLKITVDTLKTASAGMALLLSSSDELAGMVEIKDAETDAALGSFYVDVLNSHGGLLGLAMRGAGIREKLVEEFALESSRALTGRKSKTKTTRS